MEIFSAKNHTVGNLCVWVVKIDKDLLLGEEEGLCKHRRARPENPSRKKKYIAR